MTVERVGQNYVSKAPSDERAERNPAEDKNNHKSSGEAPLTYHPQLVSFPEEQKDEAHSRELPRLDLRKVVEASNDEGSGRD